MVNITRVLLAVLGFVLPFAPFALVGWLLYRLWRKVHPDATPAPLGSFAGAAPGGASWPPAPQPPVGAKDGGSGTDP